MRSWLAFVGACASAPTPPPPVSVPVEPTPRSEPGVEAAVAPPEAAVLGEITYAECPLDKAITFDVNGDGVPDVFTVREAGVSVCKASNLDFKGGPDVVTFYQPNGAVRAEIYDFDGDGAVDTVTTYDGANKRVERDTNGDGRADLRETHVDGRCTEERDIDGDGRVDHEGPCD